MSFRRRTSRTSDRTPPGHDKARPGRPGFKRRPEKPELREPPSGPEIFYAIAKPMGAMFQVVLLHKEFSRLNCVSRDDLLPDEIIRVRLGPPNGRMGPIDVEIVQRLGVAPAGIESLIAIENSGMPVEFPPAVLAAAEALPAYAFDAADKRSDWRALPFVTIDGADARDFDDAVQAEPHPKGGWLLRVAIADVAHYVMPDSALDLDGRERGNSSYFPDRVVPMLPERLSNNLCSLMPDVDRPVLGVAMHIDVNGVIVGLKFHRAVIHSHARLTYERVNAFLADKQKDAVPAGLHGAMEHLKDVYYALERHKTKRGALDLNIPESQIVMDAAGGIAAVQPRPRLISHRLIEECMIAANVAAAQVLATSKYAGLYRVHDVPSVEKLENLRASLAPLGLRVPQPSGGPKAWVPLIEQINKHPAAAQLLRSILQSQMQARYDTGNIGHYGLALPLYSHFTSPIRRYADLVTHRALIAALKLGPSEGVPDAAHAQSIAGHINLTERRSQHAEWEARDRLVARYFADLEGTVLEGTVVSIRPFGAFLSLGGVAEGLIPARLLEPHWHFNMRQNVWQHRASKKVLSLGVSLPVKLIEADWTQARLTLLPVMHAPHKEGVDRRPVRAHKRHLASR